MKMKTLTLLAFVIAAVSVAQATDAHAGVRMQKRTFGIIKPG